MKIKFIVFMSSKLMEENINKQWLSGMPSDEKLLYYKHNPKKACEEHNFGILEGGFFLLFIIVIILVAVLYFFLC